MTSERAMMSSCYLIAAAAAVFVVVGSVVC